MTNIESKEQWEQNFFEACERGNLEDVRHLCQKQYLKCGWANIHRYENCGFRMACSQGQLNIVKYLLTSPELIEEGHTWADLNAKEDQGCRWACEEGHLEVVKYLLTSSELIEAFVRRLAYQK